MNHLGSLFLFTREPKKIQNSAHKSIPNIKDKYLEKAQTSLHLELREFRGNKIKTMGSLGGELLLAIVTR